MTLLRFMLCFFLLMASWSVFAVEKPNACSIKEVYEKEREQIQGNISGGVGLKAFNTRLEFPSRYIYVLEEGARGESTMMGDLLVRTSLSYLGCDLRKSIYGNAWFGNIDKCENCRSGSLSEQGGKLIESIKKNDLTVDVYMLGSAGESSIYTIYIYDAGTFLAVMDGNQHLINSLRESALADR